MWYFVCIAESPKNTPLADDVDLSVIAKATPGFSGADLANLLNEAAILAARENRPAITNLDLYEAINKVIIGPQKKSRVITESDKRITAYHEAGHAILAKVLPHCDPVQEVSIIPRGGAGGYTLSADDDKLYSYGTLVAEIINGKPVLYDDWDYSQTTIRHVREFLRQHGFNAESKSTGV